MLRFVNQTIFGGQENLTGESCALSDRKEPQKCPQQGKRRNKAGRRRLRLRLQRRRLQVRGSERLKIGGKAGENVRPHGESNCATVVSQPLNDISWSSLCKEGSPLGAALFVLF